MPTLDDVVALARTDSYLAMVSTLRSDGTIQTSLVNAGVMRHPISGEEVVAFVTYGRAKLGEPPRSVRQVNVSFRSGWQMDRSRRHGRDHRPRTIPTPTSTRNGCACCSARSSSPRAARTTTGTSTTA